MQTEAERFERLEYEVDADAVAAAIVSRLLAGGTLPPKPDKRAKPGQVRTWMSGMPIRTRSGRPAEH